MMAVALQWTMRAMGLVSLFVLARLLTPADFGVVGLAMTAVAFVEIFAYLGLWQVLVRMEQPDRSHLDTAWTIQLILLTGLGLLLAVIAFPVAAFYGQPAIGPVLLALSLRFVLQGAINIGIVDFDRNFQFGRDLAMRLSGRIVSLAVAIGAAVILQSYWALVAGLLAQSACLLVASYLLHPYRPRFSLQRRAELIGVSVWIFLGLGGQVIQDQIDRVALGRVDDAGSVGAFAVSKDLSAIFTQEIATALNRVSFVETSRGGALEEQGARIGTLLGSYALVTAPLGIGIGAVAADFFTVFLGDQWQQAARVTQLLAPAGAAYAVYKLIASSLQAGGREKLSAATTLAGAALTICAVTATVLAGGTSLMPIAAATLGSTIAILLGGIVVMSRQARTNAAGLLVQVARPFLAATAMFAALALLPPLSDLPPLALLLDVSLGAGFYAVSLALLWSLAGRPAGAETAFGTIAGAALGKLRDRSRLRA